MKTISFYSEAKAELYNTIHFYDGQRKGLGKDFLEEVNQYIEKIIENPLINPLFLGKARRCILKRFPYNIFYYIDKTENIHIIAIAHQHRRPTYWSTRH